MGYVPVICHPERYKPIQENPAYLYYWIKDGILAQVNATSLLGIFGSKVKKTAELLVKNNLVQLIGSDAHSNGKRKICLKQGMARLRSLVGYYADQYLENAENVINNKKLEYAEPVKVKGSGGIFGKLKKRLLG